MFEIGFIDVADFVPLREAAFLADARFPAFFDAGAFGTAAAFDVLPARAEAPAGAVFVAALLAGDLLVPGLDATLLCVSDRLATWRVAACGAAGSVATAAGAGWVVLDPNAAWTVANASSNESWRVSTVTFMRCSWPEEWGYQLAMSDPRRRCSLDLIDPRRFEPSLRTLVESMGVVCDGPDVSVAS